MNYSTFITVYIFTTMIQVRNSLTDQEVNEIIEDDDQPPLVEIDSGKLVGTFFKTATGRRVYAFLGVPYAAAPINENRFKEPKPVVPWDGTRQATDMNYNDCLQINHYKKKFDKYNIVGDEDCLYLNVYTPMLPNSNSSNSKLLNVIFYIHGGAFMYAQGKSYKPKFLLDKSDIVFVSINYRLGPFGFLTLEDEVLPGNNGLKDQVFALKWVERNIVKFAGDSKRVTIAGMSAGGASVHYHYLSPLSRNLFSSGISISGTATNPWALMDNGRNKTILLAESLNCDTGNSNSSLLLQCISDVSGRTILEQVKRLFMPWLYNPFSPFGPTVEPSGNYYPFITEKPYDSIKSGSVKNAPWLVSFTADEGLYPGAEFITNETLLAQLNNNWNLIAPHLLDFNFTLVLDKHNETCNMIHDHYFANKTINIFTRKKLVDLLSDRLFSKDIGETVKLQAVSMNTTDIYFYKFSFRGEESVSDYFIKTSEDLGVSHGDDLPYILGCYFKDLEKRPNEKEMMDKMVNIWLTFIETSKPKPSDNVAWTPVSNEAEDTSIDYLDIKSHFDMKMVKENNFGNKKFWNSLNLKE